MGPRPPTGSDSESSRRRGRLLQAPLLHFLLLGALLFVAQGWRSSRVDEDTPTASRVSIDAERVAELRRSFADQTGRGPEPVELERMVEAEVDEEILYREAIARGLLERDGGVQTRLIQKMLFLEGGAKIEDAGALLARAVELGLHHEDIVVRRILVQKMKLLGSRLSPEQQISDAQVAAAYRADQEALRTPDRVSLVHVFLSSDRRGPDLASDARALRAQLVAPTTPDSATFDASAAATAGDPFPLGHRLEHRSQQDLERSFGGRFGESAFALEVGRWSEPVESAYGLHLIRVESREPGAIPPLAAVADRLRLQLEEQRRDDNLAAFRRDLRARYEVVHPVLDSPLPDSPRLESRGPTVRDLSQEPG